MSWNDVVKIWSENYTLPEELGIIDEKILKEAEMYPMSVPQYYDGLINPKDPDDPIRKMAIPSGFYSDGLADQSGEASNTVLPGVQHKYKQTLLVLTSAQCAMYCRFCFRRRFVGTEQEAICRNPEDVVNYIKLHPEVTNVLLSGGDALMQDTKNIAKWLDALTEIPQLDFIRIASRAPVTLPDRILLDENLLSELRMACKKKQIYLVTHFNHVREFSKQSRMAITALQECGVVVKNQTVLLKGVNDNAKTLGDLLRFVTREGIVQHYIFQCRPVIGTANQFQVPIREGLEIVNEANAMQNGLGKPADYTMSHKTGKIRILGESEKTGYLVFQYKQAKNEKDIGRIFIRPIAKGQTWLD